MLSEYLSSKVSAYGLDKDDVLRVMFKIGGGDKIMQFILALGQIKAQDKVTDISERQLRECGVNLRCIGCNYEQVKFKLQAWLIIH